MSPRWLRITMGGALLFGSGCSDDAVAPSVPADIACLAPNRLVGDACIEPGVADDGCPAGTLGLGDGSCQPAGIQPTMCGEGFVHDGDVGCEPILPPEPCAKGFMAVPGERACRKVMPCARGKWGDIPVDSTTEYVDANYSGGDSDGSAAKPWTTLGEGYLAAAPDAIVAIAEGSYNEDLDISGKRVRLWGVCPDKVEIVGTGAELSALTVSTSASSGSEVRGLAVTGGAGGILVVGSEDVTIDAVWIHGTLSRGIEVYGGSGPASADISGVLIEHCYEMGVYVDGTGVSIEATVVRDVLARQQDALFGRGINIQSDPVTGAPSAVLRTSLIERAHEVGLLVIGSDASIENIVVRDILPRWDGLSGRGIHIQLDPATGAPSHARVRTSLVERSRDVGLAVTSSEASIEAVVARDIFPQSRNGLYGIGIAIKSELGPSAPPVVVRSSLVARCQEHGVRIGGAVATIETTVIRDTLGQVEDLVGGRGIGIQEDLSNGARSVANVRASIVERSHAFGVFATASDVVIEATVVRDTRPLEATGFAGHGIVIQHGGATSGPTLATVRTSLIEQSHGGVLVAGSEATIEATVVRDTSARAADGTFGHGIQIQSFPPTGSLAFVRTSLIERSHEIGVAIADSQATLEGVVVRETLPRELDGRFGDGVSSFGHLAPASATLTGVRIEESARGALAVFGASVDYRNTDLRCQSVDLIGEALSGRAYVVENLGGNRCGCPAADGECVLETAGFEPPEPIDSSVDTSR